MGAGLVNFLPTSQPVLRELRSGVEAVIPPWWVTLLSNVICLIVNINFESRCMGIQRSKDVTIQSLLYLLLTNFGQRIYLFILRMIWEFQSTDIFFKHDLNLRCRNGISFLYFLVFLPIGTESHCICGMNPFCSPLMSFFKEG